MILVTGGTGLVGAQILFDLVRKGEKVRALKRSTSQMDVISRIFKHDQELLEKIEWVEGDVTDLYSVLEALEGVKEVYHAAAIISFRPSDFNEMMKINAEGTANMVNLSLEKGVDKFCSGCPSSTLTLKSGIENLLKQLIPEVTEVVAVAD